MTDPPTYISFLIRLWREEGIDQPTTGWQGEVEHIQTGQRWPFQGLDELFDLIRRQCQIREGGNNRPYSETVVPSQREGTDGHAQPAQEPLTGQGGPDNQCQPH